LGALDGDVRRTGLVIDAAIRVHSILGPGLLESAYEACLAHELRSRGVEVLVQVPMPLVYRDLRIENAYRIDLLVDAEIVVELKTVTRMIPVHKSQLLSYLKLSGNKVGLLINFHVTRLKDGIRRVVNGA
jgi:GxxExxY protein